MTKKQIPVWVTEIVQTLTAAGCPAYLVGGCVRDLALGRPVHDWDIASAARPHAVEALFPKTAPTGVKYGTITVFSGENAAEVTTFRTEDSYTGHRRPDAVAFVGEIEADLSRRDFTVNAMALGADGVLVDPFGGMADLRARRLRCVGAPERRFSEDALRMFRALRFAAVLGFSLEGETEAALARCAGLAAALSGERVAAESEKILLSPRPERLAQGAALGLFAGFGAKAAEISLDGVKKLPLSISMRWCAFCAALLEKGAVLDAAAFLRALCRDRNCVAAAGRGAHLARTPLPQDPAGLRMALAAHGAETLRCAAAARDALFGTAHLPAVEAALAAGDCVRVRDLAVGGRDLLALGFAPGRDVGAALEALLVHVLRDPAANRRETLLQLAASLRDARG